MKRYAMQDADGRWSTGSYWRNAVPAVSDLMTGLEADAMAKRHQHAKIVDVLVFNAAWAVRTNALKAAYAALGRYPETREEQRAAQAKADAAVKAAGYILN